MTSSPGFRIPSICGRVMACNLALTLLAVWSFPRNCGSALGFAAAGRSISASGMAASRSSRLLRLCPSSDEPESPLRCRRRSCLRSPTRSCETRWSERGGDRGRLKRRGGCLRLVARGPSDGGGGSRAQTTRARSRSGRDVLSVDPPAPSPSCSGRLGRNLPRRDVYSSTAGSSTTRSPAPDRAGGSQRDRWWEHLRRPDCSDGTSRASPSSDSRPASSSDIRTTRRGVRDTRLTSAARCSLVDLVRANGEAQRLALRFWDRDQRGDGLEAGQPAEGQRYMPVPAMTGSSTRALATVTVPAVRGGP